MCQGVLNETQKDLFQNDLSNKNPGVRLLNDIVGAQSPGTCTANRDNMCHLIQGYQAFLLSVT